MENQVQMSKESSTSWRLEIQRRPRKEPLVDEDESGDGGDHVISGGQQQYVGLGGMNKGMSFNLKNIDDKISSQNNAYNGGIKDQSNIDVEVLTEGLDKVRIIQNERNENDKIAEVDRLVEVPIQAITQNTPKTRFLVTWKRTRRSSLKGS